MKAVTEREQKIFQLICQEKTTQEIADIFKLSPRTVEVIRKEMKKKVGAKTNAGLVTYAVLNGIYIPEADVLEKVELAKKLGKSEDRILNLISQDKYLREIASILNLSLKTIETVSYNLKSKTKFSSIAGLTLYELIKKDKILRSEERQTLNLLCEDTPNQQIAASLNFDVTTVNTIITGLKLKTGCKRTSGLVVYAIKNGIYSIT
jgi:DNA-binding CsgD family transcriptional regulator